MIRKAKNSFYNTSPMDMKTLMGDQDNIKENLYSYIQAFSPSVRDIFERFDFYTQIDRLPAFRQGLTHRLGERCCWLAWCCRCANPNGVRRATSFDCLDGNARFGSSESAQRLSMSAIAEFGRRRTVLAFWPMFPPSFGDG